MNALFGRAVLAFIALPGMVAFVVPLVWLGPDSSGNAFDTAGLALLAAGTVLLLWCVWEFYRAGRGTLAPWSPPQHLVVTGLYRFSRNPMYIAVALILWGWALGFHSRLLAVYALAVMLAFHLRVVLGEEPWLARVHGVAWARYRARVPRWFGHWGDDRPAAVLDKQ
jgi:protein-S-isoprenylcysteine O-methyltransferase Ste14